MKNTKDIIVLDENVKHISLFRHVLPWIVSRLILVGLTVYGLFSLPDIEVVQSFFQSVDEFYTPLRQAYTLLIIGLILSVRYLYKKLKRAE
jgi:membrane protein required for beta-lactamase induction